jgi:hypothetical protein
MTADLIAAPAGSSRQTRWRKPVDSVRVLGFTADALFALGILRINQQKKSLQLCPTIDRLTKLPSLDERTRRSESGLTQQIAHEPQLTPVLGGEPKLVASAKPSVSLTGQTLRCRWTHVAVATKQRCQLLDD